MESHTAARVVRLRLVRFILYGLSVAVVAASAIGAVHVRREGRQAEEDRAEQEAEHWQRLEREGCEMRVDPTGLVVGAVIQIPGGNPDCIVWVEDKGIPSPSTQASFPFLEH